MGNVSRITLFYVTTLIAIEIFLYFFLNFTGPVKFKKKMKKFQFWISLDVSMTIHVLFINLIISSDQTIAINILQTLCLHNSLIEGLKKISPKLLTENYYFPINSINVEPF